MKRDDVFPYQDEFDRWPENPDTGLPSVPEGHYWKVKHGNGTAYIYIFLMKAMPLKQRFLRSPVNVDIEVEYSLIEKDEYVPERFYARALSVLKEWEEAQSIKEEGYPLPPAGNYPPNRMPS